MFICDRSIDSMNSCRPVSRDGGHLVVESADADRHSPQLDVAFLEVP